MFERLRAAAEDSFSQHLFDSLCQFFDATHRVGGIGAAAAQVDLDLPRRRQDGGLRVRDFAVEVSDALLDIRLRHPHHLDHLVRKGVFGRVMSQPRQAVLFKHRL